MNMYMRFYLALYIVCANTSNSCTVYTAARRPSERQAPIYEMKAILMGAYCEAGRFGSLSSVYLVQTPSGDES